MSDVRDLLHRAATDPDGAAELDFAAIERRMQRRRRRAAGTAVAACVVAVVGIVAALAIATHPQPGRVVPATTAAVPTPKPTTTTTIAVATALTLNLTVVDGSGNLFPAGTAGIAICPGGDSQAVCADPELVPDTNGDGSVDISLEASPDRYQIAGYVTGTEYHYSDLVGIDVTKQGANFSSVVTGAELGTYPVFRIIQPTAADVTVVDGDGRPFPPGMGGIHGCIVDELGRCEMGAIVRHDDDGDGHIEVVLDPGVTYVLQGVAFNTGWCNPWQGVGGGPDAVEWHFGNTTQPGTAEQLDGSAFVVADPCPGSSGG